MLHPSWRTTLCGIVALALCPLSMSAADSLNSARERLAFNADWRFVRHDPADAGDALTYERTKDWILPTGADLIAPHRARPQRPAGNPGGDVSYVQPEFDDRDWESLNLPHDWAIAGPFDQDLPGETGKLPWTGVGWYRKTFAIPAADAERHVFLDIDGAMSFSTVWLNGQLVGGWPYGYTSYRLDLTPHLRFGAENLLAIRLENPPNSSRWYPGSGLYRNVWLVKASPVRVAQWGAFVTTPQVSAGEAWVNVAVTVENATTEKAQVKLSTEVFEFGADEPVAASRPVELEIDPARARSAARSNQIRVPRPRLWDLDDPHRYVAVTTVEQNGVVVDRVSSPFGIRTVEFDPDRGLQLNGRTVPIQGVCLHHDLGALGAAVHYRALERQLEILQAMGCNSIRTTHNPSAPELLELCDRMGLLVQVEAFDCWRRGKKLSPGSADDDPDPQYDDYARVFDDWHERDLRAMVRRDRNHPSVVMWSIGNEVLEQWYADGWQLAVSMAGIVREEDRTRPTTGGFNNDQAGHVGFERAVDLIGFNYKPHAYAPFHAVQPTMPVYGAETASCISSRGEYFFPASDDKADGRADFHVSSYDLYAPRWAHPPDVEFKGLDESPFAFGEYVWTGFDYLGEPTPYNADVTNLLNFSSPEDQQRVAEELQELGRIRVPARSSYFGIIDLAGFPKDRYYLYQARWRPELPMAHILPHWNWPERVGEVTPVHVYSSGDEAELFLNGKSLGRQTRGALEYRFRWDEVVYEPGELRVQAYRNGQPWAEATMKTTGPAARVTLEPDRVEIVADGADLSYVTVRIIDADGLVVPRMDPVIQYTLSGPGEIVGVDNGDPTDLDSFRATTRKAFNGLALVIIRSLPGEAGEMELRATSENLGAAQIKLSSLRPE